MAVPKEAWRRFFEYLVLELQTGALGAGLLALRRLVEGYGYEITGAHVLAAYSATMEAARRQGIEGQTRQRIRELVAAEAPRGFVSGILGEEIGL